jgi:hypothetical protein
MDPNELIPKVVEEYISANWSSTKIAWENVEPRDFTDPAAPFLYDSTDPYIFVSVSVDTSRQIEMPNVCKRYYGQVMIDVHVPEGKGSRVAKSLLGSLNDLLEDTTLSNNIRIQDFNRIGNEYQLRQGWATYAAVWPIEAEFEL